MSERYDWLMNRSELEYVPERLQERFRDLPFPNGERVQIEPPLPRMSLLGQYFTAGSVWMQETVLVSIPYRGQEEYTLILQEIAPHFEEVWEVGEGEEAVRSANRGEPEDPTVSGKLQMSGIRPKSTVMFEQARTAALPLMEDLYCDRHAEALRLDDIESLLRYPVDSRRLAPLSAKQLEELHPLREFLLATYFREAEQPEYMLSPLGWKLSDELQQSLILRFFAGFVPYLTLYVDASTENIVWILMSMSPMRHSLKTGDRASVSARQIGRRLYFDIGQELVLEVDLNKQAQKGRPESWDQIETAGFYLRREGTSFADFDPAEKGQQKEGLFAIFDGPSKKHMLAVVLEAL